MYDIGFIEKYGTGIYMMKGACEDYGTPSLQYDISKIQTTLTFKTAGKAVIISEIEDLDIELNQRQKKALKYAFREGSIRNKIYQNINEVSNKTANLELKDLVEQGLLEVSGKGRSTKYIPSVKLR